MIMGRHNKPSTPAESFDAQWGESRARAVPQTPDQVTEALKAIGSDLRQQQSDRAQAASQRPGGWT